MLRENLKDAGQIVQNIISQPLSIPGIGKEISLHEAAKRYNPKDPSTSELKKMLETFLQYPNATEAMLTELELLCCDLA